MITVSADHQEWLCEHRYGLTGNWGARIAQEVLAEIAAEKAEEQKMREAAQKMREADPVKVTVSVHPLNADILRRIAKQLEAPPDAGFEPR